MDIKPYLHGNTALQFELQLDHVNITSGAEFLQLCRLVFYFIGSNINWF